MLAIKLTRHHAVNDLELVTLLSRPWNPYQGAPTSVLKDVDMEDVEEEMQNSLELAITASAKRESARRDPTQIGTRPDF